MKKEKLKKAKAALIFGFILLAIGIIGRYTGYLNFVVIPLRPHYLSTSFIVAGLVWTIVSLYFYLKLRN